ncbi:unnamed protein product [Strongylus vulgaris]|uniref:Uncharacterized protein n=1 Tax=Strongylus vulgaris TaxID=40348 RepID=A0A3P7KZU6_STRVU|nr:unnamed protein product [Strongylus vulgaris]
MVWIAARTPACISPVGITGFDTGVDERKRWCGMRVPSSCSNVVSGALVEKVPAVLVLLPKVLIAVSSKILLQRFCNWYWLPSLEM